MVMVPDCPSSEGHHAFAKTGPDDSSRSSTPLARRRCIRFNSTPEIHQYGQDGLPELDNTDGEAISHESDSDLSFEKSHYMKTCTHSHVKQPPARPFPRLIMYSFLSVLALTALQKCHFFSKSAAPAIGAEAGPIPGGDSGLHDVMLLPRQTDSPTDVCFRWAHMTAVVNGTLYIFGGQASAKSEALPNTWNNDFLTLDLTKSWQITTPPLAGLPQPSGPPKVALGSLWNSYTSLYLYGGEYSSNPPATPDAFSLWEYDIAQGRWLQHDNPRTSAGENALGDGGAVERAAEGAAISVPSMGRAYYFGGHQDGYTTLGWSQSIPRIYLTSLLEYTFAGFSNDQITSIGSSATAGQEGAWRNITSGGVQSTNGFSERADGLLVHVPGYGNQGILVGLAGGTNATFQQMDQVDIFDIATSQWYKQAVSGPTPKIRVNACAVVASAADGSSQNIYMFGGQNLQPAAEQTQYNDMWILTVPGFTWIQVDQSQESVPYARAGHSCNAWNGQMIVVGGYISPEITCDSPGIYVFDMSKLSWGSYSSLDGQTVQSNPFNQQPSQVQDKSQLGGVEGSYGYQVPAVVQNVIGGGAQGGATVTQPVQLPTDGPMKTGRPYTYTVTTTASGTSVTETAPGQSKQSTTTTHENPPIAAIIAGVVAGVAAVVAIYLGYCTWLYRRRLAVYKRHMAMAQRSSYGSEDVPFAAAAYFRSLDGQGHASDSPPSWGMSKYYSESTGFVSGGRKGNSSSEGSGGESQENGRGGNHDNGRQSVDDLLAGGEPSFWGTMLSPKRSLRVTNRD